MKCWVPVQTTALLIVRNKIFYSEILGLTQNSGITHVYIVINKFTCLPHLYIIQTERSS